MFICYGTAEQSAVLLVHICGTETVEACRWGRAESAPSLNAMYYAHEETDIYMLQKVCACVYLMGSQACSQNATKM